MTTESNPSNVAKYKRTAIVGAIVGLVLIGTYVAYEVKATPSMPVVQTAQASELVDYIANDRGLAKLSEAEQQHFLERLRDHLIQTNSRRAEMKEALLTLKDEERKQFSAHVFEPLKDRFINEAEKFSKLKDEPARYAFIAERVKEFATQSVFLKDLAAAFKNDWSGPDDYQRWIMEHVTAKERAIAEPYIAAIKQVSTQLRKQERATKAIAENDKSAAD